MKKILVVSYHFPPFEGSCSDKNQRIVKKLLSSGFEVLVLTKNAEKESRLNDPNLIVMRTVTNGIFHKSLSVTPANTSVEGKLRFNYKKIISDNLLPDATIDWFNEAKKTFLRNRETFKDVDLILSISSPYSAHFVSAYISKKINKPYIMAYGDPWIYEPKRKRGFIRYRIEKLMEQKLVQAASKILLITEWNKEKYQELYSLSKEKVSTYHIGFDPQDKLDIKNPLDNDNVLKIIYGGSLDEVHRNPQPFLEAMRNIEGVHLSIYNSDNSKISSLIKEYGIENKVSLSPLVPSSTFNELLNSNDALLLFGNKTPFQVPGKIFNYIATEKTIVYVKNNSSNNDGTQEVLEEYGNYVLVDNTVESIIKNISEFKKDQFRRSNIEKFTYDKTMQPIVDAINEILGVNEDNE